MNVIATRLATRLLTLFNSLSFSLSLSGALSEAVIMATAYLATALGFLAFWYFVGILALTALQKRC